MTRVLLPDIVHLNSLKKLLLPKILLINTEINTNTDNNSVELGHNGTYLKDIKDLRESI